MWIKRLCHLPHSPLNIAKVCKALLDAGADPAAQSGEECTILHYLVQVFLALVVVALQDDDDANDF